MSKRKFSDVGTSHRPTIENSLSLDSELPERSSLPGFFGPVDVLLNSSPASFHMQDFIWPSLPSIADEDEDRQVLPGRANLRPHLEANVAPCTIDVAHSNYASAPTTHFWQSAPRSPIPVLFPPIIDPELSPEINPIDKFYAAQFKRLELELQGNHSNLSEGELSEEFYAAQFERLKLELQLNHSNLSEDELCEDELCEDELSEGELSEGELSEAKLSEAKLSELQLSEAKFSELQLSEAKLSELQLSQLQPFGPKLSERKVSRVYLSEADPSDSVRSEPDHDYKENDEFYMLESMQKEILKIENISEASLKDLDGNDMIVLCNYDAKDNIFKFHFKHWQDMASIVGVGLKYAQVVLMKGWEVEVQEVCEKDWVQAWKAVETSSTTTSKLLRLESNSKNQKEKVVFQKPLLWDLAKYFTLVESIHFLKKCATTVGGPSSASQGSSSNDNGGSIFQEGFSKWFLENRINKSQARKSNKDNNDDEGDDKKGKAPADPDPDPSDAVDKNKDTKVLVQLLPGGDICEIFGKTFSEHEHGSTINQKLGTLDRTIFPNLEFTFVNQDETKKIEVVIGNISFSLGFNAGHGTSKQVEWIHNHLKVSFGLRDNIAQRFGELDRDSFKHLDMKTGTEHTTESQTTEKKKGREIGGRVELSGAPHGVGIKGHVEGKHSRANGDIQGLETGFEREVSISEGGLIGRREVDPSERQIVCSYSFPHHQKMSGSILSRSPMSFNQVVRFQATWIPLDAEENGISSALVPYTLIASRSLQEIVCDTNIETIEAVKGKTGKTRKKEITQREAHIECLQKHERTLYINHAMTHLDGEFRKLQEREWPDRSRYFSKGGTRHQYVWKNGALVKLEASTRSSPDWNCMVEH